MATADLLLKLQPGTWTSIEVQPTWESDYVDLDFIHEPFNDPITLSQWVRLGFQAQKFTGDLYDMRSPTPSWMPSIEPIFNLNHFSWSVYRMTPGTVLPEHRDTYRRFREVYNVTDIDEIVRCVVFLEDWQSGHYFEIDRQPIVSWSKGRCVCWKGDVPHMAANLGVTNRYTLQITGTI